MTNVLRELERLPNVRELHHWADYAELNCLASPDHLYGPTQLATQLRRGRDSGEATDATTQGDANLDNEVFDVLLGLNDEDDGNLELAATPTWDPDLDSGEVPLTGGPLADSFTQRVDDIWRHLRYRSVAFGNNWPFELDGPTRMISLRSSLTAAQRTYVFLLLCSSLRYEPKAVASSLTTSFERVAYQAFIAAYPGWEVHIFGTAALAGTRYDIGQLWERLSLLSQDIRCTILAEKEHISEHDVGDNGLDLVAWLPLPENSKGLPLAFGQCACGASDWIRKQAEVSEQRWGELIKLASPVMNWTFIPFCYHGPQGDWEIPHHVHKGVLVDRLRFFRLLESRIDQVQEVIAPLNFIGNSSPIG